MRPSQVALSGMPSGKTWQGWWGDLGGAKQKGIVTYTLSPYQQRAFKGVITGWILNGSTRLLAQVPYWIVPFGIAYSTYLWGKSTYEYNNSKEGHHKLAQEHAH
ncbi:cytochrome b-c1 complex subunit 8 [Naematelia encephala]|uniref:Cytochrome b-c1 complex subunit 8 n=1 Tax=Naematelia encephala TaxID=71784 RepID=A0A1Y2AZZ5_9TREE|nr:cytochrome b-c1 complex subunit 8 [Naematelia encephala]